MALVSPFTGNELSNKVNDKLDKSGGNVFGDVDINGNLDIDGILDMNGNKISNVATPTQNNDGVNKAYVDNKLLLTSGDIVYTDSINGNSSIVKYINIPEKATRGIATIQGGDYGLLLNFSRNNDLGKAAGYYYRSTNNMPQGGAWSVKDVGIVSSMTYGNGTGTAVIYIDEFYIQEGYSRIKITFRNAVYNTQSMNCRIAWEVW